MAHILVQGGELPPGVPTTPPRLDIVDLIKDEKLWSLYIQALILLQETRVEDDLSWFAVSCIHGWPMDREWQNAGPKQEKYGYCTHSDTRFPTWHRPYIALYEQALQRAAVDVASKYETDRDDWGQAAYTLRSPYWDWANPESYLPPPQVYDYKNYQTLNITTPGGKKDLPNPLLAYKFQVKIDWVYSKYPTTVRHPNAPNPIEKFESQVKGEATISKLHLLYWRTLNWLTSWEQLSNDRTVIGQRANSLETLHNWIHNRTGGDGHMGNPISAGYDPIFMLHHTNVDRSLAFYQALHPEVWISDTDAQRKLIPFWKTQSDFHLSTSDSPVRKFVEFRATYPEFVGLENATEDERKQAIQRKVNELYNPQGLRPGLGVFPSHEGSIQPASNVAPSHNANVVSGLAVVSPPQAQVAQPPSQGESRYEWFVNIRAKKHQLKGSYEVAIFLGDAPEDPEQWVSSPSFAGSHGVFANSSPESCGNCRENADLITEGFITLNWALRQNGYEHKSEAEVEEYIHDNIDWRISKADGTVVPVKELEVLEVAVLTFDLTKGDVRAPLVLHDIVSHKDGGYDPSHRPYSL